MKQAAQVADHHRGENLTEEDFHLEEEAKEEMFGVTHVENGDMCHGTALIINQQVRGMRMWLRQSQNHLNLWKRKNPLKQENPCGTVDNLVSTEMVDKLGLARTIHPIPYKVSWLQKGHQIIVIEQCKVEIQIGMYKEVILCDVMPMDQCHVLLGRPWQFD
eukprot:PITA_35035